MSEAAADKISNEGANLLASGEFEKALQYFEGEASANSDDPANYYNLALVYEHRGEITKTIEALLKCLQIGRLSNASLALSEILKKTGHYHLAREILNSFVTQDKCSQELQEQIRIALLDGKIVSFNESPQLKSLFLSNKASLLPREKLKIYSDRSYLPDSKAWGCSHNPMLWPFWGLGSKLGVNVEEQVFQPWRDQGINFFELTSLEEADFAVYPGIYFEEFDQNVRRFAELAAQAGKKTLVFEASDCSDIIAIPNTLVFRTSLYRSSGVSNEFAVPSFVDDPITTFCNGKFPFKKKMDKAVVSFCGQPIREYLHPRNAAIVNLGCSNLIKPNFIIRDGYFNSYDPVKTSEIQIFKSRLEYTRNLLEGDYNLVVRGAGNYSFRLYETLAAGRIPVFLDTDCVLPLDQFIDWKKHSVWVDYREIGLIAYKIADFHNDLTNDDFMQLQLDCRMFWEQYLTPLGFFGNLYRFFSCE